MGYNLDDMREANRKAGQYWFSADTMRAFHTRISETSITDVPGGALFVSSDTGFGTSRMYTVRYFDAKTGDVGKVNGIDRYASRSGAIAALKRNAEDLKVLCAITAHEHSFDRVNVPGKTGTAHPFDRVMCSHHARMLSND